VAAISSALMLWGGPTERPGSNAGQPPEGHRSSSAQARTPAQDGRSPCETPTYLATVRLRSLSDGETRPRRSRTGATNQAGFALSPSRRPHAVSPPGARRSSSARRALHALGGPAERPSLTAGHRPKGTAPQALRQGRPRRTAALPRETPTYLATFWLSLGPAMLFPTLTHLVTNRAISLCRRIGDAMPSRPGYGDPQARRRVRPQETGARLGASRGGRPRRRGWLR